VGKKKRKKTVMGFGGKTLQKGKEDTYEGGLNLSHQTPTAQCGNWKRENLQGTKVWYKKEEARVGSLTH